MLVKSPHVNFSKLVKYIYKGKIEGTNDIVITVFVKKILKMKVLIILASLSFCLAYTPTYDKINVEQILKNRRLLKRYVDCLLGVPRTCNREGQMLKDIIPDALQNKCAECNETQKKVAKRVSNYVIECKPEWWEKLEVVYDPKGTYKAQYREELLAEGININGSSNNKKTKCYN
ncbi:allergen Tha p 1-like [Leptinotarsa decemlineata]|uniref:allergen Tha p 1-like n=1 Tax=Leptinotarsa decemlineata TaxID=7539 RepID=UPI003D30D37E